MRNAWHNGSKLVIAVFSQLHSVYLQTLSKLISGTEGAIEAQVEQREPCFVSMPQS